MKYDLLAVDLQALAFSFENCCKLFYVLALKCSTDWSQSLYGLKDFMAKGLIFKLSSNAAAAVRPV